MTGRDTVDLFEVKLGRRRSASGHMRVESFLKRLGKSAKRVSLSGRRRRSIMVSQRFSSSHFDRRVIVKASLHKKTQSGKAVLRNHLNYIERDGADEKGRDAELYADKDREIDKAELAESWKDDRHHFRFIVSPEDADQMGDLKGFTRDLMRQMETDLNTKLEWVAANHHDTDQPHVHIVLRGKHPDGIRRSPHIMRAAHRTSG